jgi:multidrug resistance efflux pump
MKARYKQLQESHDIVNQELKISKPMAAQGVMSAVEILRLERQLSDVKGQMDAARLAIPRLEQAAAEARSKITASIAKFRSDAAADLNLARAELAGTSAVSMAVQDRLTRTEVRSPVAGVIKQLKVTTVGGVIHRSRILRLIQLSLKKVIDLIAFTLCVFVPSQQNSAGAKSSFRSCRVWLHLFISVPVKRRS